MKLTFYDTFPDSVKNYILSNTESKEWLFMQSLSLNSSSVWFLYISLQSTSSSLWNSLASLGCAFTRRDSNLGSQPHHSMEPLLICFKVSSSSSISSLKLFFFLKLCSKCTRINDTYREKLCLIHFSARMAGWLLLTFLIRLHKLVSSIIYSIITY